jgi:hypothetical protein
VRLSIKFRRFTSASWLTKLETPFLDRRADVTFTTIHTGSRIQGRTEWVANRRPSMPEQTLTRAEDQNSTTEAQLPAIQLPARSMWLSAAPAVTKRPDFTIMFDSFG